MAYVEAVVSTPASFKAYLKSSTLPVLKSKSFVALEKASKAERPSLESVSFNFE